MGLFDRFLKKDIVLPDLNASDEDIVAVADSEMIDISTVPDEMFAQKMLGESTAFRFGTDKAVICAPASGTLSVLFPTGHAFGITMKNGVELLVHIGIDTVNANGTGFRVLKKKQGDPVKAGDPVIEADIASLSKTYDMSTMLIVTNPNGKEITFKAPCHVSRGDIVVK